MSTLNRSALLPHSTIDIDVERLLLRAQDHGLIDGWGRIERGYELTIRDGSFQLEPDTALTFVNKLLEMARRYVAYR